MTDMHQNPYAPTGIPLKTVSSDPEQVRNEHIKHEASIKSIGILYMLGGIIGLLIGAGYVVMGIVIMNAPAPPGEVPAGALGAVFIVLALVAVVFSVAQLVVAFAMRKLAPWARIGGTVISALGLLGIPIGTLISGYVLYLLWSQKGTMVFSPYYKEVIQQTPHIKYKTSIIIWIFLGLLVALILLAVFGALVAG